MTGSLTWACTMAWISAKEGPGGGVVTVSVRVTHPVRRKPAKGSRKSILIFSLVESGSVIVVIMVVTAMVIMVVMIRMPMVAPASTADRDKTS